jgi:hypothetical protein
MRNRNVDKDKEKIRAQERDRNNRAKEKRKEREIKDRLLCPAIHTARHFSSQRRNVAIQ